MNFYAEDVSRSSARNIKRDVLHQLKHRADLRDPQMIQFALQMRDSLDRSQDMGRQR
jgi:hypothetical protein